MNFAELNDAPDLIKQYLVYMESVKGKSTKTVDEYYRDLKTFFRFIKLSRGLVDANTEFSKIDISDVDIELIKTITLSDAHEFLKFCKTDRSNNNTTRARKVSSLRGFFKYLTNRLDLLKIDPMIDLDTPKKTASLPKFLTLEQSFALLDAVDGPYKERDYAILTIFLNCGLRLSELCGLNISDITDKTMRVFGKGSKERFVYMNEATKDAIQTYLACRPRDGVIDRNALFLSRLKRRISPKTVQHIVYVYLEKIGLDSRGYSVHKLRHTAATLMYQGGTDIRVLKEVLGHENLSTTEIYTHVVDKQLEEASNSNPLGKIRNKK